MNKQDSSSENTIKLSNNEIELLNFLEEIFTLDQSTPNHDNAKECYIKLLSKQNEFVGSNIEDQYWNAISLELFHIAQTEAQNDNLETARDYFSKALDAAKKGFSNEWRAYIEGTIYYLENNKTDLEGVMSLANDNIHVLQRLIEGLKKRGAPNYKEDY